MCVPSATQTKWFFCGRASVSTTTALRFIQVLAITNHTDQVGLELEIFVPLPL